MTSPVALHIVPNCGLKITPKLGEDDSNARKSLRRSSLDFDGTGGVNGKHSLSYVLEDIDSQGFPIALRESRTQTEIGRDFTGAMSPLSPLSLPKERKKQAGISPRATRYAYIHPPKGLAAVLDWAHIRVVWKQLKYHERKMNQSEHDDDDDNDNDDHGNGLIHQNGMTSPQSLLSPTFALSQRLLRRKNSNSTESRKQIHDPVSLPPSSCVLKKWAFACFSLLGAFVYFEDKEDGVEVLSVNALCLSKLCAQGVIRMAGPYKTPLETIQVLKKLDRFEVIPLEHYHEFGFVAKAWVCPKEHGSSNGSLVFLRDDNTALTYNVKSGADALTSGSRSILADLIDPHDLDLKMIMGQNFVTDYVTNSDDESCKRIFLNHFPNWSPLHYWCRFRTNDLEAIKRLKAEYASSVGNFDRFHRSVLHLACASMTVTGEVVRELLNNEDSSLTKRLLYGKTKSCKKLPLHVAINSGAPKDVIEVLLNACKRRQTYLEKTSEGRLPLHIAIEKMADKEVIELLLKADIEQESMYEEFKGMLPLHIACWNGHKDAVQVLLKYDDYGRTLHYNVSTATYLKFKSKKDYLTFNAENEAVVVSMRKKHSKRCSAFYEEREESTHWVRALHIALLKCSDTNSAEITKLLLRGEYWNIQSEEGEVSVTMKDVAGRNPLMLACLQNADEEIIRSLINLDQTKNTAAQTDNAGSTALHYLCEHKSVTAPVVQLLLDAEDEYYSRFKKSFRKPFSMSFRQKLRSLLGLFTADAYRPPPPVEKSTSKLNKQRMTPLKLAIRSGASTSVLKLLLQTDRIDMKDFDDQSIHQLSLRVSGSSILQESINHKLAARYSCFILITSVVYKVFFFILFVRTSDCYLSQREAPLEHVRLLALTGYSIIEIMKEVYDLISFGPRYLISLKNYIDIARIGFMLSSLTLFYAMVNGSEAKIGKESFIVVVACLLLGIDIILSLRSTFLPFAKFAGGLIAILSTLIPFFIVSAILLVCFIVAFRVEALLYYERKIGLSSEQRMEEPEKCQEFWSCASMVLKAFFTGEYDEDRTVYLFFGFGIILILLTIIIAIVSDAWDAVEITATEFYWESRITFLHESRSSIFDSKTPSLFRQRIVRIVEKIAELIDDFGHVGFHSEDEKKFSWTRDSPYNQVADIDQYKRPYDYFHPSIAEVIKNARSFQSDVYWISQKKEGLQRRKHVALTTIQWFGYYVLYCFLFLLGIVTGGFFWPTGLRRSILSYGYDKAIKRQLETDMTDDIHGSKRNESKTKQVATPNDEMIPKRSNMNQFDDFFTQIMGISPESALKIDPKSKLQMIGDKIGVKVQHDCSGCD